jgi:hypothetical protein
VGPVVITSACLALLISRIEPNNGITGNYRELDLFYYLAANI